jgi:hypothetical protein
VWSRSRSGSARISLSHTVVVWLALEHSCQHSLQERLRCRLMVALYGVYGWFTFTQPVMSVSGRIPLTGWQRLVAVGTTVRSDRHTETAGGRCAGRAPVGVLGSHESATLRYAAICGSSAEIGVQACAMTIFPL